MGFLDRFTSTPSTISGPPDPVALNYGHTPPEPPVEQQPPPQANRIFGQSGRANYYGLPETDELNRRLVGREGLRQFDLMYWTDPHIKRLILMAWAPILAGSWSLDPFGGDNATDLDRKVAETIWWMLTENMAPSLLEHMGTVGPVLLRSGFCPFEQIWQTVTHDSTQYLAPRKLDLRLPRSVWKWWQDNYGELTAIGQILPNQPQAIIPAQELVYYRLSTEGDNWQGMSMLRHAYKPWLAKDRLERIDMIGQERKAKGVPVVYRSPNITGQVVDQVEAIINSLGVADASYLMVPGRKMGAGGQGVSSGEDEWLVDMIQFDSSAGAEIQSSLQYHKQAIEASFAQDFMSLGQHQVGARATAEVQEDPYLAAVGALLQVNVLPPIQKLVDRIAAVNWGDKIHGAPKLVVSLNDVASLSEISAYVQQLAMAEAIEPDPELEDWLRERADMPPANPDIRKAKQAAKMAGFEQAANPPDPVEMAKARAGNGPPDEGGGASGPPAPAGSKTLDATQEPTARWFDRLLSQERLREAFDGCRDHVEAACREPVLLMARNLAVQAINGSLPTGGDPPAGLTDALTRHYEDLYRLGAQTVTDELAKQRRVLTLDDPTPAQDAGAAGARWVRARQRGAHSARNILGRVQERLGRDQITGLRSPALVQQLAEREALAQLRVEALANTTGMVNDGRYDQARASSDVVGAYYTSVLDERTCGACEQADTGVMLSPEDAVTLGPPNPDCEGSERCRCALVWVLSDDPAALAAVV